jgi:hypothetical protein
LRTNVGSLDHADIITTISNAADPFPRVLPDEPCNICLLCGRASTRNHRGQFRGNFDEFGFEQIQAQLQE